MGGIRADLSVPSRVALTLTLPSPPAPFRRLSGRLGLSVLSSSLLFSLSPELSSWARSMRAGFQVPDPYLSKVPPRPAHFPVLSTPTAPSAYLRCGLCSAASPAVSEQKHTPDSYLRRSLSRIHKARLRPNHSAPSTPPTTAAFLSCPCDYSVNAASIFPVISAPMGQETQGPILPEAVADRRPATVPRGKKKKPAFTRGDDGGSSTHVWRHITDAGHC